MADVRRLPVAPHIEEEAAAWVARQDTAPLDPAAEGQFRSWLNTSPAHQKAFKRYSDLWSEFDDLSSQPHAPARREAANDKGSWLNRRAIAASVGILLVASVTFSIFDFNSEPRLETAIGEQRTVTLADGSRITLNTNTGLTTDLDTSSRRISLEHGEALFEVAHDASRPFIVESPFGSVRAVGTKFVVRVDETEGLSVVVTEGKVIVTRPGSAARSILPEKVQTPLAAGQELETVNGQVAVANLRAEELSRQLAWRQGDIVFEGETLAEAVAEMQRYTPTKIYVDQSVARYSVGGYFRTGDIDSFVSTIEDVFPVKSERSGNSIRLTKRS